MLDFDLFFSSYQNDKEKVLHGLSRIIDFVHYSFHVGNLDSQSSSIIISKLADCIDIFSDKYIEKKK